MKRWKRVAAMVLIDDAGWVRAVCFPDANGISTTLVGPLGTLSPVNEVITQPSKVRREQISVERDLKKNGYL